MKAVRGNCVRCDDESEYWQKRLCARRLPKANAATSNCVQNDCKKAGEERMLLMHLCTGRLQKANAAKSDRVQGDCKSVYRQKLPCVISYL